MSSKNRSKNRSKSRASSSRKNSKSRSTPSRDEPKRSLLPNDVLRAIEKAKKKNPKDKYGDSAFRINVARLRQFQNKNDKKRKATYIPFEIYHNGDWMGVNIRVMNVKTEAKIKEPEEREYGISLTFRQSSSFMQKMGDKEVEQRYGEAVVAIYEAFQRIAERMVKKGKLTAKKTNALTRIAYETSNGEKFEDPMFRADLRTDQDDENFTDLNDDIRDVRRRLKKKMGLMPYDLALDGPDDDEDSKPLTPATVHTFFKFKTPVFGVHCLDQVCLSNQGISVPSYYSLLAAKKPKGMKPTYEAHFDADEMDQWADAEAYEEDEDGSVDDAEDSIEETAGNGEYDDMLDGIEDANSEDVGADEDASASASGSGAGDAHSGEGEESGSGDDDSIDGIADDVSSED